MKYISKGRLLIFLLLFSIITTGLSVFTAYGAKKDEAAPTAPINLKAALIKSKEVSLSWSKSTDNVGVTAYHIYKDGRYIGKTSVNSYVSTGLDAAKNYSYFVKAVDASGNFSKKSQTISVTTLGSQPANPVEPEISNKKRMVGYYAAWSAYSGFNPDKLDASKLTHINYAFANIGSDLKITLGYPDIDPANIKKLNSLKQTYPKLKTLISVGGWSWSGRFSDAALTDASRTAFADSAIDFIIKYGFDGIDIDWEYPVSGGLETNSRRSEDKKNFTLLIKKLREKLDERSSADGKQYLLTIAGAAGSWYVNNTELELIHPYLDYANVMTYDIHGTWDKYTDFNAPLYKNNDITNQYKWSVGEAVNAWLKTGFPSQKLVVGVPFYGYRYTAVNNVNNGLYQTYSGGSSVSYANIKANYLNAPGYTRYFHKQSMVPWLFNGSTLISYEDEQSIGLKAQYIKDKNLGGSAIWELSQDPDKTLLSSLYNGLK